MHMNIEFDCRNCSIVSFIPLLILPQNLKPFFYLNLNLQDNWFMMWLSTNSIVKFGEISFYSV